MHNNKKNTQPNPEALKEFLLNFKEEQDIKLLQQGLITSMGFAVTHAEETCYHDNTVNIVDATITVCGLLDALFSPPEQYSPFQDPQISINDVNLAESMHAHFSPHAEEDKEQPNKAFYRNIKPVISSQGNEIDKGALWQKFADTLVLVDEDEYITHPFNLTDFKKVEIS